MRHTTTTVPRVQTLFIELLFCIQILCEYQNISNYDKTLHVLDIFSYGKKYK